MTPNADSRLGASVPGCCYRALWCLVPHVVSSLATYTPFMKESGTFGSHPSGVVLEQGVSATI